MTNSYLRKLLERYEKNCESLIFINHSRDMKNVTNSYHCELLARHEKNTATIPTQIEMRWSILPRSRSAVRGPSSFVEEKLTDLRTGERDLSSHLYTCTKLRSRTYTCYTHCQCSPAIGRCGKTIGEAESNAVLDQRLELYNIRSERKSAIYSGYARGWGLGKKSRGEIEKGRLRVRRRYQPGNL